MPITKEQAHAQLKSVIDGLKLTAPERDHLMLCLKTLSASAAPVIAPAPAAPAAPAKAE